MECSNREVNIQNIIVQMLLHKTKKKDIAK